jgi:2'-5' RNA ligase
MACFQRQSIYKPNCSIVLKKKTKILAAIFPKLDTSDFNKIQEFRKRYDLNFALIQPHITLVFPIENAKEDEILEEIKSQSSAFKKVQISFNKAAVHNDLLSPNYFCFLNVKKGAEMLMEMNKKLYANKLKTHLLDLPYLPHITLGNSLNKSEVENMASIWNAKSYEINASLDEIEILGWENNSIISLEKIQLQP